MATMSSQSRVGPLLREWRKRRRRTQLDLALDAGISTRHLSFVETGRSKPSPDMVMLLAEQLEVPFRERNTCCSPPGMPRPFPSARCRIPSWRPCARRST
jgi:transcriptional regulator with XRE-family HTH domain